MTTESGEIASQSGASEGAFELSPRWQAEAVSELRSSWGFNARADYSVDTL
jgi:hypothetical protein